MNSAAAVDGVCSAPGTVVQRCLDTKLLQWLFASLTLPLLIEIHTGQASCSVVPGVAGYIPVSMACLTEFSFLTTSFKILKWWTLLFCTVNCDFG